MPKNRQITPFKRKQQATLLEQVNKRISSAYYVPTRDSYRETPMSLGKPGEENKLYRLHYKKLKEYNCDYGHYYGCVMDVQEGKLLIKGQSIYDGNGCRIAPILNSQSEGEGNG